MLPSVNADPKKPPTDPKKDALNSVWFKFERIVHVIDDSNGTARFKNVNEIDQNVKDRIGSKFQHFSFEQLYNRGLKFMSGGVNERFHVIPSNAASGAYNSIDIYMLRKSEEFPPKEPTYIGECGIGHDNRQIHRIQDVHN